jgi:hypothetical protein
VGHTHGNFWDTDTYDVSTQMTVGETAASVKIQGSTTGEFDALNWVAQVFSVTTTEETGKCQRSPRSSDCQLLAKLRDGAYFNVPVDIISDDQLLEYVKKHTDAIEALLLQVDYGRDIYMFLNGTNSLEHEKDFIKSLEKAEEILNTLKRIADVLEIIGEIPAFRFVSESISVLSTIIEGIKIYKFAVNNLFASDTRVILENYIKNRLPLNLQGGMSKEDAWRDILSFYGTLLIRIKERTGVEIDRLDEWFENAFVAYRLVGYPDSASIRYAQGLAIADFATE